MGYFRHFLVHYSKLYDFLFFSYNHENVQIPIFNTLLYYFKSKNRLYHKSPAHLLSSENEYHNFHSGISKWSIISCYQFHQALALHLEYVKRHRIYLKVN